MMHRNKSIFIGLLSLLMVLTCVYTPIFAQGQAIPDIKLLNEEEVDKADKKFAQDLGDQILSLMAEGKHFEFTEDNATPQLVQGFNVDMQKQAYQQIKSQVGDYQPASLTYQEAHHVQQGNLEAIIYRFKGDFTQSEPEVRVVLTPDNKLGGLLVVPWNDEL